MKNFVQPGNTVTMTAPGGGVVSGTAYLIGGLLVVATETVAETLPFEAQVTGVVDLPKAGTQAWTDGQKIYWDNGNARCTNVATDGQLIGVAVAPLPSSGAGETTGRVRLNGVAPSSLEGPQAAIADLTLGTNITAATANGSLEDSAATNPSDTNFNNNMKELGTKVNAILAVLRTTGIIASS